MDQEQEKAALEALDNEDPNILRAACLVVGIAGLGNGERGLIKALGHKAWQVQAEAARALGRLGAKGALPYLRRLLKAPDSELRQRILTAAAGGGKAADDDADGPHPSVAKAAAMAISRLDPGITQDALLAALASGRPELMGAAMVGLANLEAAEGREQVMELLGHDDANVRRTAATCLGKLAEPLAVPKLMELLEDGEPAVRKEALIALNNIKDRRAIAAIAARMGDSDGEVRRVAAIALANTRSRDESVVGSLVRALADREAAVRKASLQALGNLKAEKALEPAIALLADTHEEVARQAGITVGILASAREHPDYEG